MARLRSFKPFEPWKAGRGLSKPNGIDLSLPWYRAYNASKHDRQDEFKKANFENVIMAALGFWFLFPRSFGIGSLVRVELLGGYRGPNTNTTQWRRRPVRCSGSSIQMIGWKRKFTISIGWPCETTRIGLRRSTLTRFRARVPVLASLREARSWRLPHARFGTCSGEGGRC